MADDDHPRSDRQATADTHWHLDRRVVAFIADFWRAFDYAPTVREVQAGCAAKSLRTTQASLDRLEQSGYLVRESGKGRSVRLTADAARLRPPKVLLGQLFFQNTMGHRLYPYFCRAAGLAPTKQSAEGWLLFVLGQVRQNEAIDLACAHAQVNTPLTNAVASDVERVWSQVADHISGIQSWLHWITQEEFWTNEILDDIPEPGELDSQTTTPLVLEGNLETARDSHRYIREEIERLRNLAANTELFDLEVAAGRRRALDTYRGVEEIKRRIMSS